MMGTNCAGGENIMNVAREVQKNECSRKDSEKLLIGIDIFIRGVQNKWSGLRLGVDHKRS